MSTARLVCLVGLVCLVLLGTITMFIFGAAAVTKTRRPTIAHGEGGHTTPPQDWVCRAPHDTAVLLDRIHPGLWLGNRVAAADAAGG